MSYIYVSEEPQMAEDGSDVRLWVNEGVIVGDDRGVMGRNTQCLCSVEREILVGSVGGFPVHGGC
jgi:hypothetical protein